MIELKAKRAIQEDRTALFAFKFMRGVYREGGPIIPASGIKNSTVIEPERVST